MRTFGEVKQYFEFQLEGDDKVYKIPLAAHMPTATMLMLKTADKNGEAFEGQLVMLRRYMGDVIDDLSVEMTTSILEAWAEESNKEGASVGES